MKTKIIAMYLPQYHSIPENDIFWGKGFTDWNVVKKARPLYEGHVQPRVPLNDNYYDLSVKDNIKWQCQLAKKYGVYGFGIYHYWFNNEKNLLTTPSEILRDNEDIDFNYFLAWDNGNWKRSWSNVSGNAWSPIADKNQNNGPEILVEYILGDKPDWENHYNYLKTHFIGKKYIKYNNKPVFIILNYNERIAMMADYWNELAIKDGFDGIHIIYRNMRSGGVFNKYRIPKERFSYNYEPSHNGWFSSTLFSRIANKFRRNINKGVTIPRLSFYEYDKIWNLILKNANGVNSKKNIYHGCFVGYDDTPRRGNFGGRVILGASPEKFRFYLKKLLEISERQNKEYIFLTAWNEWGEGAYLEPDIINNYSYLNALEKSLL